MPLDIVGWLRWRHLILTLSIVQAVSCNADADALSRLSGQRREQSTGGPQHITSESVKAVCNSSPTESYVEGLALSEQVITDTFHLQGQNGTGVTDSELRRAQEEDPILSVWIKPVSSGRNPPMEASTSSPAHRTLQKSANQLKMKRGKLSINGEPCEQFVLPQKHIPDVLRQLHDVGRDRTLSFYETGSTGLGWPKMLTSGSRNATGAFGERLQRTIGHIL